MPLRHFIQIKSHGKISDDTFDELNTSFLSDKSKKQDELNNIDFLKVNIETLITEINEKGYKDIVVMSNLPYYITSKLLNKILVNNYSVRCIVAMMQKEVGTKIIRPEKKEYNLLSVILDYQYDVQEDIAFS